MKDRATLLEELSAEFFKIATQRFEENNVVGSLQEIVFNTQEEIAGNRDAADTTEDLVDKNVFFDRRCHQNAQGQWVCPRG